MNTDDFGTELARHLYEAERSLDLAIASVSDLSSLMTRGRIKHRIAAEVGQDALLEVGQLVGVLTTNRQSLISAHRVLKKEAERLDIAWRAAGPELKPEEDGPVRKSAKLRVVGEA